MGRGAVLVAADVGRLIVRQPVDVDHAVVLAAVDLAGADRRRQLDRQLALTAALAAASVVVCPCCSRLAQRPRSGRGRVWCEFIISPLRGRGAVRQGRRLALFVSRVIAFVVAMVRECRHQRPAHSHRTDWPGLRVPARAAGLGDQPLGQRRSRRERRRMRPINAEPNEPLAELGVAPGAGADEQQQRQPVSGEPAAPAGFRARLAAIAPARA